MELQPQGYRDRKIYMPQSIFLSLTDAFNHFITDPTFLTTVKVTLYHQITVFLDHKINHWL